MEHLINTKKKAIGTKQTLKAAEKGIAELIYIAKDAETKVTLPVIEICKQKNIPINYVETMADLGKACNIDVGAAAVAILKV